MGRVAEGQMPVAAGAGQHTIELDIGGMTCASCAARIEKKLNRVAGVTATVNYATEKAHVSFAGGVSAGELIGVVEQTGYTATGTAKTSDTSSRCRNEAASSRPAGSAPPASAAPAAG